MGDITKKGKKRWVKIIGSEFNNMVIGESYIVDPEKLIGKTLKLNLGALIGDSKKFNINLGFKIKEIKGADAYAVVVSYEILQAHVKRLVRVGQDKIEDSFVAESKDKLKVCVKPVALTKAKAKNSILTKIRKDARERITHIFANNNFKEVLNEIINGQLQKNLRQEFKKIYPLSTFEIRKLEVVK